MIRTAVLLFLAGVCFHDAWAQALNGPRQLRQSRPLVLRGGLLIDGTGKTPVQNGVIVMDGSTIVAVGREGEIKVPPGATVINTAGKTIIPGLVDADIHMQNFFGPTVLYWGVTTVGDMGNGPH